MKTLLTLALVFFLSTSGAAQDVQKVENNKVSNERKCVVEKGSESNEQQISRVYLYKNSRVKKELKFKTKNNKSKLA